MASGASAKQRRVGEHRRADEVAVAQQEVERDERAEAVARDERRSGIQAAQQRGRVLGLLGHRRAEVRLGRAAARRSRGASR